MSSMVLARKYRPRSFESMVGQGHVVQALSNALTQQRLHHAYMFTGTRGVGKTTVSRILAKSLNCVGPDGTGTITAQPCGQCQPCRDIDAGRFVDYVELDAASNRGVDEISQLLDQAVYKPVVGRFKVYMIDEVHMLSNTAFNAMLKTLEEPPEYLKFVLATTDPQKVPVTVLSRCLQFNLRPMAMQTVHEHLAQVLGAEQVAFDPGALRLLARAARGSMRDALSLTDQAIAFGAGRLEEPVVRQMLGSVDRQHVARILDAVASHDGAAVVAAVDGLRKLGLSAVGALDDLAAALQHMAVLQTVPAMADGDEDLVSWREMATRFAPDETQLFYSLALHGRAEIALAPDEYAGLLMVLLRWLAFKPGQAGGGGADPKAERPVAPAATGPAPTVVSAPVAASPATATASAPAPMPERAAPSAAPVAAQAAQSPSRAGPGDERPEPPPWDDVPADLGIPPDMSDVDEPTPVPRTAPRAALAAVPERAQAAARPTDSHRPETKAEPAWGEGEPVVVPTTPLGDRWADAVALMLRDGLIAALVRELAMQAECVAVSDGPQETLWRLRVERESLRQPTQIERLTQALQKALGGQMRIEVEAGVARDCPALRDQAAKANRQQAAERLIRSDALVSRLLEQYPGARLVPGSVMPIAPVSPVSTVGPGSGGR